MYAPIVYRRPARRHRCVWAPRAVPPPCRWNRRWPSARSRSAPTVKACVRQKMMANHDPKPGKIYSGLPRGDRPAGEDLRCQADRRRGVQGAADRGGEGAGTGYIADRCGDARARRAAADDRRHHRDSRPGKARPGEGQEIAGGWRMARSRKRPIRWRWRISTTGDPWRVPSLGGAARRWPMACTRWSLPPARSIRRCSTTSAPPLRSSICCPASRSLRSTII